MWIEAILEGSDVERLLERLMPLSVELGDDGDVLALGQPRKVAFVAGEGLRVECEARVRWSVLGIDVPITIHDVRAMLRPEIIRGEDGADVLTFRLYIEHADVAGLPTIVDEHITDKVNAVLHARRLETSIELAKVLGGSFQLPASMRPLTSMALDVAWAKVRVTDEAFVIVVSFHATVTRGDEAGALAAPEPPPAPVALRRSEPPVPRVRGVAAAASIVLGLAGLYGMYRLGERHARG